ncbi:TPA: lipid II flippase family protein [Photobacterium damselae]
MPNIIVFIIPVLYALIQAIDFLSTYSRVAGYILGKNGLGYSIQNATAAYTRLFNMMLLPVIGYFIDTGITPKFFYFICIFSFVLSGVLVLISYYNSNTVITYFINRLIKLIGGTGNTIEYNYPSFRLKYFDYKIFMMGLFVYSIHSIGVLMAFLLATIFSENKVMITQMTGMINASATLVLTIKLDPLLSLKLENNEEYINAHNTVLIARLIALFVISPTIMTLGYLLLG